MKGDWFEVDPDEGTLHIPKRDEKEDESFLLSILRLVGKEKFSWGWHYHYLEAQKETKLQ